MKANYHTHTWRCNHAAGTEREYIERAIESGIEILGFSDHTPNPCSWNINDGIRMTPEQTEGYFAVLSSLKKEYEKDIELHIGVEVEYIPGEFGKLTEFLHQYPCEYLIMGQHYVDGVYVRFIPENEAAFCNHVSQMLEGIATGEFIYLAHPDLIVWNGREDLYAQEMTRLCQGAAALGVPIEFNLLGYRNNRNYPDRRFWRIAAREGCSVIMGVDAHMPEDLELSQIEPLAREYLKELGITPMETVKL